MARDLIRLMQTLFVASAGPVHEACWQPLVDVYRTPRGWLLKFDLAGVLPEEVQLQVQGNVVTLRGARRDWVAEQGCQYYRMEISYNHFERSIELPGCPLERAAIATEYRYGMLLVHILTEAEK
jgi:HSP20 family protein